MVLAEGTGYSVQLGTLYLKIQNNVWMGRSTFQLGKVKRLGEDLLTIVAWMYYVEGQTQEDIAGELGLSRVKVSRLLSEARKAGIVQIRITRSLPEHYALKKSLQKKYSLKVVAVAEGRQSLGQLGVEFFFRLVEEHNPRRIGLGWSTTVSTMARYMTRDVAPKCPKCFVHDLAGSYIGQKNPYSISWLVAEAMEAYYVPLPVPVLVENVQILKEPTIEKALEGASAVDIALVGIGCVGNQSMLLKTGLVSPDTMEDLQARNALGEVLMRFFDKNGYPVKTPLDERIVAIHWEAIRKIPLFIVMAAGEEKIPLLQAALKGGWLSGLITDAYTAKRLLEG